VLSTILISAQTTTATLSGTVRDQSGAAVPGARLNLRNKANGIIRSGATDHQGRYSLSTLDSGIYELRVEQKAFKTLVLSGLVLMVGGSVVADMTLLVGNISEQIVVESREPLINPQNLQISRVVVSQEIDSLPISGRNFVDFVKLSSGIASGRENVGGGSFKEPDAGVGATAVPRLSFGGQSELSTLIQVDGVDNIQTLTGLPRATPSQEAVREFRVINSSYLAEYGRALGGFVNIVTKSGDHQIRGYLYYFGQNQALNAAPILSPRNPALRQNQYGLTVGGPVVRDRTFFFGNYEGQRRAESNKFSQVILSNLDGINAMRARFGLHPEVDNMLRSNDYDQFLIKVDHHFDDNNTLTTRYNLQAAMVGGFLGGGGRASPASSTARNSDTLDQSLVMNEVAILGQHLVNEVRFQWARRSFKFNSVLKEPALEIPNLIIMGKSTSDMDFYCESRAQFIDNVSLQSGGHQFKSGLDYNNIRDETVWGLFFPARIIFPNLGAFLDFSATSTAGPVNLWWPQLSTAAIHPGFSLPFTNAVPAEWNSATIFHLNHSSYGLFAQDQWNPRPKWTLTYGLRYDVETYPTIYVAHEDLNNLQPRIGLSYAYDKRGVMRAGFGIYHDRIANSVGQVFAIPEWNSRGDQPNAKTLFPAVSPIPGRFRQINAVGPAATPATIKFLTTGRLPATGVSSLAGSLNRLLRNPYSKQASLQVSQQIGGVAVSASYLFVNGAKLVGQTANLNAFQTGILPTGKPILAGRRFPNLGNFTVISNVGNSTYHGGTFELEKQFDHGFAFHSSYTFSKTISDIDSTVNLADIPEGLVSERALSRQHVGQRFTLSLLSQTPTSFGFLRDFKLGSIVTMESGRYYTIFVGSDANGDGNPNSDRPELVGRNSLKGPSFATWDLRVARSLHFNERWSGEFSLDIFNLLNRVNIKDLNTVYGSFDLARPPDPILGYLTPRDAFGPRQIQFGVKLRF
jgi:outer membrane receptor protein involved in Fe transport